MMYGATKKPCIRLLTLPLIIILSLVLIVPVLSGCGGGEAASNTFLELLNLVPADVASWQPPNFITLVDFASYFQDYNITFTTFEELTEKIKTNNIRVFIGGSDITGYSSHANISTIRKEYVGYDITCVDAEIQFGNPPTNGVAAIGRFVPQDTIDAFDNRDEWPSWAVTAYTTEEYLGVTIHSWGSGLETHITTRFLPPHVDELGRARPLAVTDKYLFYAASVEDIKLMIDASQGQHSSLADLPEYAAIASGLTDLRSYIAMVGDESAVSDNPEHTEFDSGLRLKSFLTFGSGVGEDEKGIYTAIVLYHENSNLAQENVSLLKQRIENLTSGNIGRPWREIITDSDIRAEGNVLLAKLYSDSPVLWQSLVYTQDTLLIHEE